MNVDSHIKRVNIQDYNYVYLFQMFYPDADVQKVLYLVIKRANLIITRVYTLE